MLHEFECTIENTLPFEMVPSLKYLSYHDYPIIQKLFLVLRASTINLLVT